MKKLITGGISLMIMFVLVGTAAASFKANDNNPQQVAYYPTGPHGIPGEDEYHEGSDLVERNGGSGNFQQWFYGTSESEGLHGDHTVWKISKSGCPEGWLLILQPYPEWGDYLTPDVDYCVKTNDFKSK